ncbi:MAG: DUF4389 domain-containing protein [Rhodomicrobium sp.]
MDNQTPAPISERGEVLKRGLFMLLFAIAFGFGQMLLHALVVVQFFWLLFTQERNEQLARFGSSFSVWFSDVARFQSCATDDKPFPWRPWP